MSRFFSYIWKEKYHFFSFLILLAASVLIYSQTAHGEENKKVLFISSYAEDFMTVPDQIAGIKSVFKDKKIHLSYEYMNMKKYNTTDNLALFYHTLQYRLALDDNYDVIIAADDDALQFALDYKEQLFPSIPVVFLCINDPERAVAAVNTGKMTGVSEVGEPLKDTIGIARKFYPNATRVLAIIDDTISGNGDKKQFYDEVSYFPDLIFEDINTFDYTYEELGEILEGISEDTILLYMSMFNDKTGAYMNIEEAVSFLSLHTKVPVFRHNIGGVGSGLLGGKMISYFDSGVIAAQMALDIMDGRLVSDIPMIDVCPDRYIFDYELIKQFRINEKLIPAGATLVNKEPSLFEEHKDLFITLVICAAVIAAILLFLLGDNIYRRNVEKKLKSLNMKLNQAYADLAASEEELRAQLDTIQSQMDEITLLNQKYVSSLNNIDGAAWELELPTKVLTISQEIENITDAFVIRNGTVDDVLSQLFSTEWIARFRNEVGKYINEEITAINMYLPFIDEEENENWVMFCGKGVFDSNGQIYMIHGILLDVTKMKKEEQYIAFIAEHDDLTKLPNRILFMKKLEKALKDNTPGSVFILDIDNFKRINDTLGHIYGDKVLSAIGNKLQTILDENIFVSRLNGDEFLILLTGVNKEQIIYEYANQVLLLFSEPLVVNGIENYISFSMGIANFPTDSSDPEQLIMKADTAMYKVKKDGKNNFMFYFEGLNQELKDRIVSESKLRAAIKNRHMELYYQPQVDIKTMEIGGFEALLRFNGTDQSPYKFIILAEELGLIIQIGRWVTEEAIRQIASWRDMHFKPKTVSINFSSGQLKDESYISFLEDTLKKYNVDPKYLEIEITESIFLEKTEKTMLFLNNLKAIGIKLALDDFGTGYSSLNYLTYIPVDKIKLDKSLVDRFLDAKDSQFIRNLISLVHGLNMTITAEGVELKEQFDLLKDTQCDSIQGYLFSRPIDIEKVNQVYNKHFSLEDFDSPS